MADTQVLILEQVASADSTIDFTADIDSTYDIYEIHVINAHPSTDNVLFQMQGNASGQTGFNEVHTSIYGDMYNNEAGTASDIRFFASGGMYSVGNATIYQNLHQNVGADADQNVCGIIRIYNPSSTAYSTHVTWDGTNQMYGEQLHRVWMTMYFNTSAAIDEIGFKFSSGNIDSGTFKLFGIT